MSQGRVHRVQFEMGLRLPPDYARFLIDHGHAELNGIRIFGYCERMSDVEALPCVIGATRRLGPLYGLAGHELVLAQENGALFVLDCQSGKVLEVDWLGGRIVAESFGQWLCGLAPNVTPDDPG